MRARTSVLETAGNTAPGTPSTSKPMRPSTSGGASSRTRSKRNHLSASSTRSAPITRRVLPVGVQRRQMLERVERPALAELLLDPRHGDSGDPADRQLAHARAIVERGERLGERVAERGDHDDLVDLLARQDPHNREDVGDVRRVEAPTEDGDGPLHVRLNLPGRSSWPSASCRASPSP